MFTQSTILVTGGTGSLGYELVRQLLAFNPAKIIIYTRNESAQVAMSRAFTDPRLTFRIGDIRDIEALRNSCAGVDYLFHLAALKHVPICEEHPLEALKTNVLGTQNIIHAAIHNKVKKVINMSTDKAADPSNFYGMTKAIGEKLMILSNHSTIDTKFISVRGGNILGTSGSVLHLFMDQIRGRREVTVTDLRMSRFFMTLQDVGKLLIHAAKEGLGGEIFVMLMRACTIVDLAETLIEMAGTEKVPIVESGIRPGEKITELLTSEYESRHAVQYQNYVVILPAFKTDEIANRYAALPPVAPKAIASSDVLMTKKEIKEMLLNSGYIS